MKCTFTCTRISSLLSILVSFSILLIFYINHNYLQRSIVRLKSGLSEHHEHKPEVTQPKLKQPEMTENVQPELQKPNMPEQQLKIVSFLLDKRFKNSTVIFRSDSSWSSDDSCCEGDKKAVKTQLKSPAGSLPIYVHPISEDQFVSGSIIKGGMWEKGHVIKFYNIFKKEKDLQFLDIGANIGIYGLTMAKLGVRVLMVEPFLKNVQKLCNSVRDGGYHDTFVLHNALSSSRHRVGFGTYHKNIGGTYVRNVTSETEESSYALLLDDILEVFNFTKVAIKLDVETHEAQVLQGASKFFEKVEVKYLMVEWHKDKEKTGSSIIEFLTKHKMVPHHPDTDAVLDTKKLQSWPGDIFWKRT